MQTKPSAACATWHGEATGQANSGRWHRRNWQTSRPSLRSTSRLYHLLQISDPLVPTALFVIARSPCVAGTGTTWDQDETPGTEDSWHKRRQNIARAQGTNQGVGAGGTVQEAPYGNTKRFPVHHNVVFRIGTALAVTGLASVLAVDPMAWTWRQGEYQKVDKFLYERADSYRETDLKKNLALAMMRYVEKHPEEANRALLRWNLKTESALIRDAAKEDIGLEAPSGWLRVPGSYYKELRKLAQFWADNTVETADPRRAGESVHAWLVRQNLDVDPLPVKDTSWKGFKEEVANYNPFPRWQRAWRKSWYSMSRLWDSDHPANQPREPWMPLEDDPRMMEHPGMQGVYIERPPG